MARSRELDGDIDFIHGKVIFTPSEYHSANQQKLEEARKKRIDQAIEDAESEGFTYLSDSNDQSIKSGVSARIGRTDLASKLPAEKGRQLVLQTVDALRKAKVWSNDLLDRFAEVLAQLWKESSRGRSSLHSMSQSPSLSNSGMSNMFHQHQQQHLRGQQQDYGQRRDSLGDEKDPLGLTIKTRMSMSVVFDCAWKWREQQVNGAAEQLENTVMTNPTNPDSSTHSTPPPGAAVENPAHTLPTFNPHINTLSMPLQLTNGMASANSFEMFDSVSWLLDTQPDWTYGSGNFGNDFGV